MIQDYHICIKVFRIHGECRDTLKSGVDVCNLQHQNDKLQLKMYMRQQQKVNDDKK